MERKISPLIGISCLLAASLLLLSLVNGCGGENQPASPPSGSTCANGTVASFMGTSCTQETTIFNFKGYSCTSAPTSICDALGINGSNIKMRQDPNGPHTFLVGATSAWNVEAGENVHVTISGTVAGSMSNQNWPHFNGLRGQTGDGVEDNKTTVYCSSVGACAAGAGVSDIPCTSTSPEAFCTDQPTIAPYLTARATFAPAPSNDPYPFTIEVILNGGTFGTATLYSVGVHLSGK